MNADEIERRLRGAFDAQAHAAFGRHAQPPSPRFASTSQPSKGHLFRVLAPLAAAAAVIAVVVSVVALRPSPAETGKGHILGAPGPGASATVPSHKSHTRAGPPPKAVHIKLLNADGSQYGVGMPVIAFFSKKITSGKALQDATKATVNGRPLSGAWYFEYSSYYKGYPIEAHWRPQSFWPAHAKIHMDIPAKGLSAGKGMAFDDSLTLDFSTGARNIAVVNDATHEMSVTTDGRPYGTFPVSLGAQNTPTAHGVKVIMEKGVSICMRGPGYYECHIKYTQRLTYGGEYLHSAPWNCVGHSGCVGPQNNIGSRDSSNGCTNLLPSDAAKLYHFLEVGDVVKYPNASGPQMQLGSGYGDWNLNWGSWQSGGLVPTH